MRTITEQNSYLLKAESAIRKLGVEFNLRFSENSVNCCWCANCDSWSCCCNCNCSCLWFMLRCLYWLLFKSVVGVACNVTQGSSSLSCLLASVRILLWLTDLGGGLRLENCASNEWIVDWCVGAGGIVLMLLWECADSALSLSPIPFNVIASERIIFKSNYIRTLFLVSRF